MKNSFFKRAIATVTVVPIALTQCLSVANAVDVNEAAGNVVTLDTGSAESLLYIAPDEAGLEYVQDEAAKTFTKLSNWGSEMQTLIMSVANSNSKSGTLDASKLYEQAVANSGQFAVVTQSLIDKISDITYSVADDGTITIKASLDNITPTYTERAKNTVGGAMKDLADKYHLPELENREDIFGDIIIAGDLVITIDGSELNDYNLAAKIEFTDKQSGKTYKGAEVIDWALGSFDRLKNAAKDECAKYDEIADLTDAYKQIDDSVKFYVDKLEMAKRNVERALKSNASRSVDNVTPIIEAVSKRVKNVTGKTIQSNTASELMSTAIVSDTYAAVLDQLNTLAGAYSFDISADEIGTLGDSLYDITASTQNGVATFTAKFPDKEAAAAEAYLEGAYNVDVTEVHKEIEITVDFSAIETSGATANMIVKRVATYEDVVTTTTTTTTTSTDDSPFTSTTTTTVEDIPGTTTTTTDEAPVTTTTDEAPVTTTTDEAPVTTTTDEAPVTTTTTTDEAPVTTTTTTDEAPVTTTTDEAPVTTTTDEAPVTTTTTEEDIPGTTTTTQDPSIPVTRTEYKYVTNFETETTVGFYLDIDPEFNIDQIQSIKYSVDYSKLTYDEDDNLISQEIILGGEKADIKELVGFIDVPAQVLDKDLDNGVKQFAHQIPIYAKADIIAESDGRIIAYAGDALTNVDGSKVSVTAYIGLKGDANLDLITEASDASVVLKYYAGAQTGGSAANSQFTTNTVLVEADPMLDEFAAFLADVDNENDTENYVKLKPARTIDSTDASFILTYFSRVQTGNEAGRKTWNDVLGDKFAKN